jgi:hypothetical protein
MDKDILKRFKFNNIEIINRFLVFNKDTTTVIDSLIH